MYTPGPATSRRLAARGFPQNEHARSAALPRLDRELWQPELIADSRNHRFERSLGFDPLLSPLLQGQLGGRGFNEQPGDLVIEFLDRAGYRLRTVYC